jgi:hypothetical protein
VSTYAVVALFIPLDIGTTISRHTWPARVTLASNFTAAARHPHLELHRCRAG